MLYSHEEDQDENKQQVESSDDSSENQDAEDNDDDQEMTKTNLVVPFHSSKKKIEEIKAKYENRKGKSLFLLYPKKLPIDQNELENLLKPICPLLVNIRRYRQKSSRCCVIDFNTKDDCDESFKILQKTDIDGKKLKVQHPKTDSDKFLKKLMECAERKKLKALAKRKLRKEANKTNNSKLTSTIVMKNVLPEVTISELKKLFPNSIDISRPKEGKNKSSNAKTVVFVTFPTPEDAKVAKNSKLALNGEQLKIAFANRNVKAMKKE